MRTNLNSRGLAALMAVVGLAVTAPFAGCGGGDVDISKGTGGKAGAGGEGGEGGDGGTGGGVISDCGNGKIEGTEACDDGNDVNGDGCDSCSFTCNNKTPASGDAKCDDLDPCNGAEKCQDDHLCAKGTALADGTDCGNGQICLKAVCSSNQCGDLFVSATEECEDGNVVDGDGCDNCKFTCLSSDPTRNCTSLDPCVATACDDATHTCGSPLPEGTNCGAGQICKNGACTATLCGDKLVEGAEICDDGNLVDGDGCDADCTPSCVNPAMDCPAAPVCQTAACDTQAVCTTTNVATDPACIAPNTCENGACQAPAAICGNGITEVGEACDFGGGNGINTGCESNCQLSCTMDANCVDMNSCNGTETCTDVMVGGQPGKKCSPGTNLTDCTACTGGLCRGGTCTASTCGDTCIDMGTGEQCEPPNTLGCDATCKTIICGNGVRESGEQCDDSNTTNMDGCSSECKFEQVHRANWLAMQYGTDTYCPANRLGSAIAPTAQSLISDALTASVNDGSISVMFHFLGLDDLTGTNDPGFELGPINGSPVMPPTGTMYNGAADLDWWYTVAAPSLDPNRLPRDRVSGNIAGKVLNAGPGSLTLNLLLSGSPAALNMSKARMNTSIGGISTPLISVGSTPGHLSSENIDPTLQSFDTMGQPNATGAAKLCGNVTAQSLSTVPVPALLLPGGSAACIENYTTTNSLLDVLIGGCRILGGFVQVIIIRQPDEEDPNTPMVGMGPPYTLTRNATTKQVNGCRDMTGATVNLALCLNDAAYSAYFKFTTDRVIGK